MLIFFAYSCGAGMEHTNVIDCDDDVTTEQLDIMAWELAVELANQYGSFYFEGDEPDEDEEDDADRVFTDSDLSYSHAPYVPEKHDMYRCGGGSFMDDINK